VALDALTRQHSTFTRHELARFVSRHTEGAEQFAAVLAKVEASPELVRLGQDGRGRERFSTREMLAAEQRMEQAAAGLAEDRRHGVLAPVTFTALDAAERRGMRLGAEQRDAVRHVTREGGLALVVGYAGTGKSALLGVAREAWEAAGYRVRGAALSGIAAEGLEAGSGIQSRTLASLEWGWKEGRDQLGPKDVLVVDEAGMVGSRQMERVLSAAQQAGAKVVLVGDPEQLQAIEAGAAFRALAERHGAVEVSEVRRQRAGWQREATRELATARTGAALGRYERAGMVAGHGTREEARAALVEGWDAERGQSPSQSRLMLAYTRADVAELNALARERLRAAGELGHEHQVATERGERAMATGDRLMFLRNERGLGAGPGGAGGVAVKNGTLGTVLAVEAEGERLTVRLDGPGGARGSAGQEGKDSRPVVTFYAREYGHIDHGYAATIHKAQGVTVDRAHVLASSHMDRHAAYVALTRHRDGVSLHYGRDEFSDSRQLARALGRERLKDTSLDYGAGPAMGGAGSRRGAEREEDEQTRRYAERRGLDPLRPASEIVVRQGPGPEVAAAAEPKKARAGAKRSQVPRLARELGAEAVRERMAAEAVPVAPAPLLPTYEDRLGLGRDSLGRGTSMVDVATAVARDRHAQDWRRTVETWLGHAYRDPAAAMGGLLQLELAEGGKLGAARALRHGGPEMLGELRGKAGWFTSKASRAERDAAERCAASVPDGFVRLREAEEEAGRRYVREVEAQRARDAVPVPGLSEAAWAAVRALERAGDEAERAAMAKGNPVWARLTARQDAAVAQAWAREVASKPLIAAELGAVARAAERRLGEDGVREAVQGVRGAVAVTDAPGQRAGVAGIGRALAVAQDGKLATQAAERAVERAREAERERLGLRRGYGLGM
jgi:Ti-type conjugative transfer relaxase TraA